MTGIEATSREPVNGNGLWVVRQVKTDDWYEDFCAYAQEEAGNSLDFLPADQVVLSLLGKNTMRTTFELIPSLCDLPEGRLKERVESNLSETAYADLRVQTTDITFRGNPRSIHPTPLELRMGLKMNPRIQTERIGIGKGIQAATGVAPKWMGVGQPRIPLGEGAPELKSEQKIKISKLLPRFVVLGGIEVRPVELSI